MNGQNGALEQNETGRVEAFSDGVLAIIITIAVLGLRPQHGTSVAALRPVLPSLRATS